MKRFALKVVAGTEVARPGQTKAGADDPIWSVIAQHERARAAYSKAVRVEVATSGNIPDDAADELMAAGRSLLTTRPTTLLGAIAVLRYVRSQEDDGDPDDGACPTYLPEEVDGEFWAHAFFDTIADALSLRRIEP
jgi:hypothetical protein